MIGCGVELGDGLAIEVEPLAFVDALGNEHMEGWYKAIVQMNGAVKFGKTVLSPTTAARNFMSAMFFTMANGHFNLSHAAMSMRVHLDKQGVNYDYLRHLKELGVVYDTPEDIVKMKDKIMLRAVHTETMPQNNKTNMLPAERELIRCWIEQGAVVE